MKTIPALLQGQTLALSPYSVDCRAAGCRSGTSGCGRPRAKGPSRRIGWQCRCETGNRAAAGRLGLHCLPGGECPLARTSTVSLNSPGAANARAVRSPARSRWRARTRTASLTKRRSTAARPFAATSIDTHVGYHTPPCHPRVVSSRIAEPGAAASDCAGPRKGQVIALVLCSANRTATMPG